MSHTLVITAIMAGIANCAIGFSDELASPRVDTQEDRILFNTNGTSVTIGTNSIIFGIAAALGLAATAAIAFFYAQGDDSAYSGSEYSGYASSSSEYSSRGAKFSPYSFNWESLSILDWITMGQEAWEMYDPYNLECQKRFICEIHQNKSKFGGPINTMVQLCSYLQYAEVLSLPGEVKLILEEYKDASEKGKTMQKDCGEVYEGCDFSVSRILDKFSTNKI